MDRNYNQVLKPKLLLGRMTFRTNEQRIKWLAMELPDGMYWGGESGANMVDSYLEPGAFDIYTQIPAAHLLKQFVRLMRRRDKNIQEILELGNGKPSCSSNSHIRRFDR